jgi:hypothetical protein
LCSLFFRLRRGGLSRYPALADIFVSRHQRRREQQLFLDEFAQGDSPVRRERGLKSQGGVRIALDPHRLQTPLTAQRYACLDADPCDRLTSLARKIDAGVGVTFQTRKIVG